MNNTLWITLVCLVSIQLSYSQQKLIQGIVVDSETGADVAGATVSILNVIAGKQVKTDNAGSFSIMAIPGDTLLITSVGYKKKVRSLRDGRTDLVIKLVSEQLNIEEIEVVSTGYQNIPKERATGSFDIIDNETFNRSVGQDVMSRLENVSSGLLFNRGDAADTDPILIRGRSTITADAAPLIVVDNFPYDGDLENINPNDVENVSILKDAAAASIWGARAANGVIVINTKRGKTNRPSVILNHNFSFQGRPDLYNISWMSSAERIEWERFLFENGYYSVAQSATTFNGKAHPIPETVELLIANPDDLEQKLADLKKHDVREDLKKYFYRSSLQQQHSFQMSGKEGQLNYAFSAGYDQNRTQLVAEGSNRITLRKATSYKINDKLKIDATLNFIQNNNKRGNNPGIASDFLATGKGISPYAQFADVDGKPLPYYSNFRKGFIDTVGGGYLMDWTYRPLEEIKKTETSDRVRDLILNVSGDYQFMPGIDISVLYQYQNQNQNNRMHAHADSYGARNSVNRYTQIDYANGTTTYPVPQGGSLWMDNLETQSHQGRVQLNIDRSWNKENQIDIVAGYEIRSKITKGYNTSYRGYLEEYEAINNQIDYVNRYPVHNTSGVAQISLANNGVTRLTDNFLSMYANASYNYRHRYTISGSLRKDEANLFGVKSNMRGTPLWSIGAVWQLDREPFYQWNKVENLRIRATYGVNGNISRAASAYTTGSLSNQGQSHGLSTISIVTPPNEKLRWEKVNTLNLALEFTTLGSRVSGTVEYYKKKAIDLLASAPFDPTLGFTSVYANTASMTGRGWDVYLKSINLKNKLIWETDWIYSFNKTTLLDYLMPVSDAGRTYVTSVTSIKPVIGMPLYTAHSFKWGGLDPEDGSPRGYVEGEPSTDYNTIYNTTKLSELVYHGPSQPVHYGAVRNSITFRNLQMSFNISYKLGHYFRLNSISNAGVISGWSAHGDFSKRWQQPGDEKDTYVPSMIYPVDTNRDNVYRYASVHIQKADVIRLEDVNLSYTVPGVGSWLKAQQLRIYLYASNLGTLWISNKAKIDPYFNNVPKQAKNIAMGVSLNF